MITPVPRRPRGVGDHRRPSLAAAVALAIGSFVLAAASLTAASPVAASPARPTATSGCQAVGGGTVSTGGGPNRATVVVDTGSGPVWSACISFSGSISGIEALQRADAVITDLDPVFDQYSGIGKAVCRLRGVGTDPPDCLGKSVDYWAYSHNGKVAPVGAGSVTVNDGDVEGWRYGTGGKPRDATEGTKATSAPPATTTTTRPPTVTTTLPSTVTTAPSGGGLVGDTAPDGSPADPDDPDGAGVTEPGQTTTTAPGSSSTTPDGSSTTLAPGDEPDDQDGAVEGAEVDQVDVEDAAALVASGSSSGGSGSNESGSGSALPSALGFAAVIAAIGGGALVVHRRRVAAQTPLPQA